MKTSESLWEQVIKELERRGGKAGGEISVRGVIESLVTPSASNRAVQLLYEYLKQVIKDQIVSGLYTVADTPISSYIWVKNKGEDGVGAKNGAIFKLYEDKKIEVSLPQSGAPCVLYVNLHSNGTITIDNREYDDRLAVAKINIPDQNTLAIQDDYEKGSLNGYIVTARDLCFKNDFTIDDDTIVALRNNMDKLLADNLVGRITLSEGLKIFNVRGTIEVDSEEIRILYLNKVVGARLSKDGVFFYDENGKERARFTKDDARIGNIRITPHTIESVNYTPGLSGFQIRDTGVVEFFNAVIRGTLNAGDIVAGFLSVDRLAARSIDWSKLTEGVLLSIITTDIRFSVSPWNVVNWTGGIIYLSDGTMKNISEGNTGEITDTTFIYFDVSAGIINHTTDFATAVGNNKTLLATAKFTNKELSVDGDTKGLWRFNNNVIDESPNQNNGERINFTDGWVYGKFNKALQFNGGSQQEVRVSHNDSLAIPIDQSYSIEFWIKANKGIKGIMTKGIYPNPEAFRIGLGGSPWYRISMSIGDGVQRFSAYSGWEGYDNGEYHYVVFTIDRATNEMKLYIDAEHKMTQDISLIDDVNNTEPIRIGWMSPFIGYPEGVWFTGELDEIRFSKRALTEPEIQEGYYGKALELITRYGMDGFQYGKDKIARKSILAEALDIPYLSAISQHLGTIISGLITGAIIRTAVSGSRIYMDGDMFIAYDNSATPIEIFRIYLSGANVGDIIIGNFAGGQGIKWDNSAGRIVVLHKGTSFPASPIVGEVFYRTDQNKYYIYKGGATPTWEEIGAGDGAGDMLKSVYDTNENNIVDNSEKLEGSTKSQVRDHEPRTPLMQNFDFAEYEAQNIVVHKGTSFPGSPSVGQLFYRTDEDKYYIYKGYATPIWEEIGIGAGGYTDRGDADGDDFTEAVLFTDGNWHDLNLSSIIPQGTKAVLIRVLIVDDAVDSYIFFRKNSNINEDNKFALRTQAINTWIDGEGIVACDSRIIEYKTTNTTFSSIGIIIKAWWK